MKGCPQSAKDGWRNKNGSKKRCEEEWLNRGSRRVVLISVLGYTVWREL